MESEGPVAAARQMATPRRMAAHQHAAAAAFCRHDHYRPRADYQSPPELYRLPDDRCESHNLATEHPDKVKALNEEFQRLTQEFTRLAAQDMPEAAATPAVDPNAVKSPTKPTKVAYKLKLKPGMAAEYRKRHQATWPELAKAIREAGVSDFTIYLDKETDTLFAVQTLAPNHTAASLRDNEIMRKWWAHMAPLMETNPDQSPVRKPLAEVFHQE